MGMRLHVAKKYEIQYATTPEAFPYKIYEFHKFLTAIGVAFTGDYYDEDFEVEKETLKECIELLKDLEDPRDCAIIDCLKALDVSANEMYQYIQRFINASDPDNDWMLFSFF